jgi:hypothetical protein
LIRIPNCLNVLSKDCPPGTFRILTARHDVKTTLAGKSLSMKLETFPLVPAYALTVEKMQGSTLDGIVLGTLHHASRKSYASALLYVALSRVRRLTDLYLTEPLTLSDIKPPNKLILIEMARLALLTQT